MLSEIGDKLPPGPPDGPEWYWGRVGGELVGGQPGTLYGHIIRIRIVLIPDILATNLYLHEGRYCWMLSHCILTLF